MPPLAQVVVARLMLQVLRAEGANLDWEAVVAALLHQGRNRRVASRSVAVVPVAASPVAHSLLPRGTFSEPRSQLRPSRAAALSLGARIWVVVVLEAEAEAVAVRKTASRERIWRRSFCGCSVRTAGSSAQTARSSTQEAASVGSADTRLSLVTN